MNTYDWFAAWNVPRPSGLASLVHASMSTLELPMSGTTPLSGSTVQLSEAVALVHMPSSMVDGTYIMFFLMAVPLYMASMFVHEPESRYTMVTGLAASRSLRAMSLMKVSCVSPICRYTGLVNESHAGSAA